MKTIERLDAWIESFTNPIDRGVLRVLLMWPLVLACVVYAVLMGAEE
jgi:hypothetical protein